MGVYSCVLVSRVLLNVMGVYLCAVARRVMHNVMDVFMCGLAGKVHDKALQLQAIATVQLVINHGDTGPQNGTVSQKDRENNVKIQVSDTMYSAHAQGGNLHSFAPRMPVVK